MSQQEDQIISKAREAASDEEYEKAIDLISKIPKSYKWSPSDLIFKARVIQLSESQNYNLKDVENILENVIKLAPNDVEGLIEMAFFQSRVNDCSKLALKYFNQAQELCKQYLCEIEEGIKEI